MKESVATREIIKSFKEWGHFAYKIPDPSKDQIMKGSGKRPFDICVWGPHFNGGIEVKQIKQWKPFGIKELAEHQVSYLRWMRDVGEDGLVFLNVRIEKSINRLIAWRIKTLLAHGRYSREDLQQLPYIDGRKGRFPLYMLKVL